MPVELTESDRAFLRGERGEAAALAMRIVVEMAGEVLPVVTKTPRFNQS